MDGARNDVRNFEDFVARGHNEGNINSDNQGFIKKSHPVSRLSPAVNIELSKINTRERNATG